MDHAFIVSSREYTAIIWQGSKRMVVSHSEIDIAGSFAAENSTLYWILNGLLVFGWSSASSAAITDFADRRL